MIYCYVSSETCVYIRAFRRGDTYMDEPVSQHGDLVPWRHGKRETLRMSREAGYTGRAARAVKHLLW